MWSFTWFVLNVADHTVYNIIYTISNKLLRNACIYSNNLACLPFDGKLDVTLQVSVSHTGLANHHTIPVTGVAPGRGKTRVSTHDPTI